ncbi:MAG: hypothetical protein AAF602_32070, partial [Myxococcota bacterium]
DDVAIEIESRFAELVTAVPTGFPALFDQMMLLAEPGCPEVTNNSEGSRTSLFVRGECTTSSGTGFRGSIDYAYDSGFVDGTALISGMEMFAQDLRVESADGRFLEADGYFSFNHVEDGASATASSYCTGRMRADDASAGGDPWLGGEVEGLVAVFVGDFGGYRLANINATVATDDPDIAGINMQDLRWEPGQCDIEMMGTGSIREVSGVWHDVIFATRTDDAGAIGCDGCGDHLAAGSPQDDPVCNTNALDTLVDFSGGLPW